MKTGCVIACVVLGLVLIIFMTNTICYEKVKKSALNAFLERYDNAKVVESSGPAYLIDAGGKLVELNFQIDIDSSKIPRFKDKTTDRYIVDYETSHGLIKRMATRISTSETFELGKTSITDRIFIDTDILISIGAVLTLPAVLVFFLVITLWEGILKGIRAVLKKLGQIT